MSKTFFYLTQFSGLRAENQSDTNIRVFIDTIDIWIYLPTSANIKPICTF